MVAPPTGVMFDVVDIPGGTFAMGSDDFYPEERPVHERRVDAFRLMRAPVTNAQFAHFVVRTSYVTTAERELPSEQFPDLSLEERTPGSLVFTPTAGPVDLGDWRQWWRWVPRASWRRPEGRDDTVSQRAEHPVVQVSYEDAVAFATWAGGRLPTEAEHEYAAGCGAGTTYAWGDVRDPGGRIMANTWRGRFPYDNRGCDGWGGTSPVGSFPANDFGLHDCIGNVWEWTSSTYGAQHRPQSCGCSPVTADGDQLMRVLKGGSHLCAPEYCLRYRPSARSPQAEDSATTHIGFRVAWPAT